jgi:hypothetical protein
VTTDQGAITREEFDAQMERLLGNLRADAPPDRYVEYVEEVRRRYGHKPYDVIRKAVTLILDQGPRELPYANNEQWGMWLREAERQLGQSARIVAGLLPVDETRQEKEERERFAAIYERVGPDTEPFEWHLCLGIAKARKRQRLLNENPALDTVTLFRTPKEKLDFGPGADEPTEAEVRDVYAERRREGIAVGKNPTATSHQAARDTRQESPALRDPGRWLRQSGGFKSARDLLEERRASGRLEPRMEEYLLDRVREEEAGAQA